MVCALLCNNQNALLWLHLGRLAPCHIPNGVRLQNTLLSAAAMTASKLMSPGLLAYNTCYAAVSSIELIV